MNISEDRGWRGRNDKLIGNRQRGVWCGTKSKNRWYSHKNGKRKCVVAKRREYIEFDCFRWTYSFYVYSLL